MAAEMDIGAWKKAQSAQEASNKKVAAKNLALLKKTMSKRGGGGGRRRGPGATRGRGQSSWKNAGRQVSLLVKVHKGGLQAVGYSRGKKDAEHVDSNMLSKNTDIKGLLAEFKLDAAKHPRVTKDLYVHISLSRPAGHALTTTQWQVVVRQFLKNVNVDAEGCQYIATRHPGEHDHIHLVFSRSKPDGSLVKMSNSFYRFRAACRAVEKECGIEIEQEPEAVTQRQRSAQRQVNTEDPRWIDPDRILEQVDKCATFAELHQALLAAGIGCHTVKKDGQEITGILFKNSKRGDDCWVAGSHLDRACSWPKISRRLQQNFERFGGSRPQLQPHHMQDVAVPVAATTSPRPRRELFTVLTPDDPNYIPPKLILDAVASATSFRQVEMLLAVHGIDTNKVADKETHEITGVRFKSRTGEFVAGSRIDAACSYPRLMKQIKLNSDVDESPSGEVVSDYQDMAAMAEISPRIAREFAGQRWQQQARQAAAQAQQAQNRQRGG